METDASSFVSWDLLIKEFENELKSLKIILLQLRAHKASRRSEKKHGEEERGLVADFRFSNKRLASSDKAAEGSS